MQSGISQQIVIDSCLIRQDPPLKHITPLVTNFSEADGSDMTDDNKHSVIIINSLNARMHLRSFFYSYLLRQRVKLLATGTCLYRFAAHRIESLTTDKMKYGFTFAEPKYDTNLY